MTKLKSFSILAFLIFTPSPAFAMGVEGIFACAAEVEDTKRLACYDEFAKSLTASSTARKREAIGEWRLAIVETADTNSGDMRLSLASKVVVKTGEKTVRPILAISCKQGRASVSLDWLLTLGRESIRMRTYFDDLPHRSSVWSINENFQSVQPRRGDVRFIKQLSEYSNLKTEITPFGGRPVSAEFDIIGLKQAIEPLRKSCNF